MARNSFVEWSTTASQNTDIAGIAITGAAPVSNFDDALRTMMAQLASGAAIKTEAVLIAGSTSTGKQVFATGTASRASITIPQGVAPTSPVSGDMWGTSAGGLFYRVGTVTRSIVDDTGAVFKGPVALPAGIAAAAPLTIPQGVAPDSPVSGNVWGTAAGGLFYRVGTTTRSLIDDTGGIFKGPVELPAGVAAAAPLAIPPGVAPTSPVNGDLWGTSVGLYYRRGSVTRRLLDDTANGVTNTLLASMAANTVKAQLGSAGGPTDVTLAALLTAFGTFINGSANGYVRIPLTDTGGIIINFFLQWGTTSATGGDVSITYPIAFPTTALFASGTIDLQGTASPATDAYVASVRGVTRTTLIINRRVVTGATSAQVAATNETARWLAVGY